MPLIAVLCLAVSALFAASLVHAQMGLMEPARLQTAQLDAGDKSSSKSGNAAKKGKNSGDTKADEGEDDGSGRKAKCPPGQVVDRRSRGGCV